MTEDYSLVLGPQEALTTACTTFDFTNPPVDPIKLAQDMVQLVHEYNGIGLAANQIGLPYRVFALRGNPENLVCFNPKIIMPSTEEIVMEESCLSFPGLIVKVKRPRHLRVRFTAPNGEVMTRQFTGMTARAFQHELDHLNGVLFYNKANRFHREQAFKRSKNARFVLKTNSTIDDIIS
jgi:peptide deformylase